MAAIRLDWLDVLPVVGVEPSPQSMACDHGASFVPASLNPAVRVKGLPAVAVWPVGRLTAGAAFAIVAVVVAGALDAPCASVTVSVTV